MRHARLYKLICSLDHVNVRILCGVVQRRAGPLVSLVDVLHLLEDGVPHSLLHLGKVASPGTSGSSSTIRYCNIYKDLFTELFCAYVCQSILSVILACKQCCFPTLRLWGDSSRWQSSFLAVRGRARRRWRCVCRHAYWCCCCHCTTNQLSGTTTTENWEKRVIFPAMMIGNCSSETSAVMLEGTKFSGRCLLSYFLVILQRCLGVIQLWTNE